MALATLSPWPTTTATVARAAARTCLQDALPEDLTDDRLDAIGEAAAAMIERFAPDAPQAVRNEAVVRLGGYMHSRRPRLVQSVTAGSIRVNFREPVFNQDLIGTSGAKALLLPWRTRRALPVETEST